MCRLAGRGDLHRVAPSLARQLQGELATPGVGQGGVVELVGVLEGRANRGSNPETRGEVGVVCENSPTLPLPDLSSTQYSLSVR